jgi:hypothetical protein
VGVCTACALDLEGPGDWFVARAAIAGSPPSTFQSAIPDLQEELEERTYLRHRQVWWDDATQQVMVEVEDAGGDAVNIARGLPDDLSDSISAVVADFDTVRIEVIDVRLVLSSRAMED